jgi:hypothetical protein
LQHEKHLLDLVRVSRVPLTRFHVHDRQRKVLRRDGGRVVVLSRTSSPNKSVLRTLKPLDFGVLERGPIGFAVAEAAHVAFHDLLKRHADKFRRPGVPCDVHLALS